MEIERSKKTYSENKTPANKTLLIEPDHECYALEKIFFQNFDNLEWSIKDKGRKTVKVIKVSADESTELELNEEVAKNP